MFTPASLSCPCGSRTRARSRWLSRRAATQRRGVQVLEAILVLPLVLLALAAFMQFGPLMLVQQTVTNAAEETAREVSKIFEFDITDPVDLAKAEGVVNTILGVHGLQVGSPGLLVILEDANGVACLGDASLSATYCPPATRISDSAFVQVTLILVVGETPVPNVLKTYCVDLSQRRYEVTATIRKSCPPQVEPSPNS